MRLWHAPQERQGIVEIYFKTRKLERVFNSEPKLRKQFGDRRARAIAMRLAVLRNARTLSDVPTDPPERRHKLAGKRKGQYAVDLDHPYRLVFEPHRESVGGGEADAGGGVKAITIIEVTDYH